LPSLSEGIAALREAIARWDEVHGREHTLIELEEAHDNYRTAVDDVEVGRALVESHDEWEKLRGEHNALVTMLNQREQGNQSQRRLLAELLSRWDSARKDGWEHLDDPEVWDRVNAIVYDLPMEEPDDIAANSRAARLAKALQDVRYALERVERDIEATEHFDEFFAKMREQRDQLAKELKQAIMRAVDLGVQRDRLASSLRAIKAVSERRHSAEWNVITDAASRALAELEKKRDE
jgi:septal ring factor EnvC (AmiA/AmiB activator)